MKHPIQLLAALTLIPAAAFAQETRELGSHEHGSGTLNIAMDGRQVVMELTAPGADIVGFEHVAKNKTDRTLLEAAISDLARPLDLFIIASVAKCTVTAASVKVLGEDAEHEHDEHEHEDHEDDHDDHDEISQDEASHTEFHAEYQMDCADASEIGDIGFAYFARFPNAEELDVQIVTDKGAQSFEVERSEPVLNLLGMF